MSYFKYKRGCEHLNSGHSRITYKNKAQLCDKKNLILTPWLTQNNQWVGVELIPVELIHWMFSQWLAELIRIKWKWRWQWWDKW